MVFAIILLITACVLMFYNTQENNRVEETNLETVTQLEKIYEDNLARQTEEQVEQEENIEMQATININGYDYMGIIYIPVLDNLALPVLENYTVSNLKVSICKYSGGIEEGNFTIAGHNYKSSFGKLFNLSVRKYRIF